MKIGSVRVVRDHDLLVVNCGKGVQEEPAAILTEFAIHHGEFHVNGAPVVLTGLSLADPRRGTKKRPYIKPGATSVNLFITLGQSLPSDRLPSVFFSGRRVQVTDDTGPVLIPTHRELAATRRAV